MLVRHLRQKAVSGGTTAATALMLARLFEDFGLQTTGVRPDAWTIVLCMDVKPYYQMSVCWFGHAASTLIGLTCRRGSN